MQKEDRASILIIAPYVPIYDRTLGALRFYQIIKRIARSARVFFVGIPAPGIERYSTTLTELGVTAYTIDRDGQLSPVGSDAPQTATDLTRLLHTHSFAAILLERYECAARYLDTIEQHSPESLVLIDADEIEYLQMEREACRVHDDSLRWKAELQRRKELSTYNRTDVILTATDTHRRTLCRELETADIRLIPHPYPLAHDRAAPEPDDPQYSECWYGLDAVTGQIDALFSALPDKHPPRESICRITSPYGRKKEDTPYSPALRPPNIQPSLTIVIPVFNGLRYTRECVKAIRSSTTVPYDIILVDNGSTDGTAAWAERECLLHIRNPRNMGFGYACNQGMLTGRSEYVILLNNDVIVSYGWAERLLDHLRRDTTIGLLGPCTNYAGSAQQIEARYTDHQAFMRFADECCRRHRGTVEKADHLVGLCLAVPRRVIMEIGVFDPRFGVGNYEDNDYAIRARMAGYSLAIARDVFVHHYGSRTFLENELNYDAVMKENKALFEEKWRPFIRPEIDAPPRHAGEATGDSELPKPHDPVAHEIDATRPDGRAREKEGGPSPSAARPEAGSRNGHGQTPLPEEGSDQTVPAADQAAPAADQAVPAADQAVPATDQAAPAAGVESAIDGARWLESGLAQQEAGNTEEAAALLADAVKAMPASYDARMAYGTSLFSIEKTEQAAEQFQEAVRLDPEAADPYNSLGCLACRHGDFDEAAHYFSRALLLDDRHELARKNLADLYMQQARYWDAITLLERILTDNPRDAEAFLTLGNGYFKLGGHESAALAYEQALRIDPEDPDAAANLKIARDAMQAPDSIEMEAGHVEEV